MRKHSLRLLGILTLILVLIAPAHAHGHDFAGLRPGEQVVYTQTIPVNVVLLGYDGIDQAALLDELPQTYEPIVRQPLFYGQTGRPIGLHFDFAYQVHNTAARFEDRFFRYLARTGQPGDLTEYQQLYNDQNGNVLDISGPVLHIHAPDAERWLMDQAPRALGIDIEHSYTVFFINWYGRDDFQFHIYTKTDAPDPDTGYNFGAQDDRAMIAWGGTFGRTWFYDLSAGPHAASGNWNVDDDDMNEDGQTDYRMPPAWEYTPGGFRDPAALSSDLGLVARYIAIDMLFTASPGYDPLIAAPGPGGRRVVHIEVLQDDPSSDGRATVMADFVLRKLRAYQPYYDWKVVVEQTNPIDPGGRRAFRIWAGLLEEDDCWNDFGFPFTELGCYFNAHLDDYVPAYHPNDYVAEVFLFNTTDENQGGAIDIIGFSADNRIDGMQTHVFEFTSPSIRELGYGMSFITTHELGHHFGPSHPLAGYDSEDGQRTFPIGPLTFIVTGRESDSIMNTAMNSTNFGQFDRDNTNRWEMAGYLNKANALLGDILAHPQAGRVAGQIRRADRLAERAQQDFQRMDYLKAATAAYRAYDTIAAAAEELGMDVVPVK